MTRLLGFIDKDRQTEVPRGKFTNRFAEARGGVQGNPRATAPSASRSSPSRDKAFRKFMEQWKLYEPALYDKEVYSGTVRRRRQG